MIDAFKEVVATLERVGFRKREAQVYLGLLSAPQGTVMDLAEACGMPRTSIYDCLGQLMEKGFVEEVKDPGDIRRYLPASPERILQLLKTQAAVLQERIGDAETVLPNLLALHQQVSRAFRVRFYSGETAFAAIRQEFEQLPDDIWQIVNYDAYIAFHNPEASTAHQQALQFSSRKVRAILLTDHPCQIPLMPGIETVVLPTALAPSRGEMTVCGDRVAFFAYSGDVMALDVQSPAIATTCRAALTMAWQAAHHVQQAL